MIEIRLLFASLYAITYLVVYIHVSSMVLERYVCIIVCMFRQRYAEVTTCAAQGFFVLC